jgi:hypothetical protein
MISILNKKEWAANLPTGEMDPDNSEVPITKPVGPQCMVCTTIWDSRAAFFSESLFSFQRFTVLASYPLAASHQSLSRRFHIGFAC